MNAFKGQLEGVLKDQEINFLEHEKLIKELDTSSELFKVLLIKTNSTIPYSSVFIRLECGYWSEELENKLRHQIQTKH